MSCASACAGGGAASREATSGARRAANYGPWKGTLYVTSAGNSALDRDKAADLLVLPADIDRMVSVSVTAPIGWATDPLNTFLENLASYSNDGRSAIDVSAPGGDLVYPEDELCTARTSMAAPHASGVAALILSEDCSLEGSVSRLAQEHYRRDPRRRYPPRATMAAT